MTDCPHPEKTVHRSIDGAFRQLLSIERDGKGDGLTWPYLCACRHWHLGHSKSPNKKMAAAYATWVRDHADDPPRPPSYTHDRKTLDRRIKRALKGSR